MDCKTDYHKCKRETNLQQNPLKEKKLQNKRAMMALYRSTG